MNNEDVTDKIRLIREDELKHLLTLYHHLNLDGPALELDEKYLECMSYGMPPMSGVGIGIDRLTTLILNCQSIRDVVFFPLMHEEAHDKFYDEVNEE